MFIKVSIRVFLILRCVFIWYVILFRCFTQHLQRSQIGLSLLLQLLHLAQTLGDLRVNDLTMFLALTDRLHLGQPVGSFVDLGHHYIHIYESNIIFVMV